MTRRSTSLFVSSLLVLAAFSPASHGAEPAAAGAGAAPTATPAAEAAAKPKAPPAPAKIPAGAKAPAAQPAISVTPAKIPTGGVGLVRVEGLQEGDEVTGTFAGEAIPFHPAPGMATALFGVDLDVKPGKLNVRAKIRRGGKTIDMVQSITVFDGKYPEQRITVPPDKDSSDDPELGRRIMREAKALAVIWPDWTGERLWSGAFAPPSAGELRRFGSKRIINGTPRRAHSGADLPGKMGDPIRAMADGRIVFVEDQFFGGLTTVIDHGHGLYSMYMHQSKADLKPGDPVKKGQKVGEVGSTGRSTGPHLHWGIRLLGARVDPAKLLELGKELDALAGAPSAGGSASAPGPAPMSSGTSGAATSSGG